MFMIFENKKEIKSCIYIIKCVVNNKIYVGSTSNFYQRFSQYKDSIKKRNIKKLNPYLLSDILIYGDDKFVMSVYKKSKNLKKDELEVILHFKSTDPGVGYNKRIDIDNKMVCHPDTSKKISQRLKLEWANGIRDGHSEKLKISWENRDREKQSQTFRKTLTRYLYIVDGVKKPVEYKELVKLGFASALSAFSRKRIDKITCKGVVIERVKL